MKKFVSSVLVILFFSNFFLTAQESENSVKNSDSASEKSDTLEISFSQDALSSSDSESTGGFLHENDGKKHPLVGIGGMLFFNAWLFSWNRWVGGQGWAQVGWEDLDHFWTRKLQYDGDWFWTNFVLHPWQGAFYYQSARGANLNKLESFGVTFLGSYMWEFICEKNAPSINDMYYTTVGSFAMGEMLYRLSLNADEISTLLAHVINPTRWWTQLWTRQKPLGTTQNIHELSVKFGVGAARTYTNILGDFPQSYKESETFPVFINPSIFVVYNDPYGHDSNDPYSQFELEISASLGKGSGQGAICYSMKFDENFMYLVRILSNGMLFSRAPQLSENTDTTLGLVMEYEFDWHQFYELSSLGPGIAIKQRVRLENSNIEWQFHGAWNSMGTTDYYYYHRKFDYLTEEIGGRNYNITTGPMTILKMRYGTENGSAFNLSFRGYGMYNFYAQVQDNLPYNSTGWEWIGIANASFEVPLSKTVRLGLQNELYMKHAFYKKVPNVTQFLNSAEIYAKLQLK